MSIVRVYTPQPLCLGLELLLPAAASQHLLRVLRMQPGDVLQIFDGQGREFQAKLLEARKHAALVLLEALVENRSESPLFIHLGQAISRGERMDYCLQKSTELGVKKITPLFSDYVNVKLDAQRLAGRMDHWRGVLVSACEQSGRSVLPELAMPMKLSQWVQGLSEEVKVMLEPSAEQRFFPDTVQPKSVAILIGAEGGFSEAEIEFARRQHFQALAFGPRILRTETAGPAAIAVLQYLWGDIGKA